MINPPPTEYEILTHKGRIICDRFELGMGYCGSVTLEMHCGGVRDPNNWSSHKIHLDTWELAAKNGYAPGDYKTKAEILEERLIKDANPLS